VILLRSHIVGFGKLQDRILNFRNGLNLIFAANEGGKSTLQRFLMASLYGQLRSDLKVQRRPDPWVEQYKPWYGKEYGGILWCRLADGREVEIHRSFGKDETRIEIRTASGEDITRQYEQQRNGEVLFARFHFGMPKELFESVGMIRENRVAEIQGYETIRDRIANLAQSGDEELSIRLSLEKIREKIDSVGSERAPTRPYKQALDLVQSLRDEGTALEDRRLQFRHWVEDRNRTARDIAKLEQELRRTQSALLRARRQEMAGRIDLLQEIQNELDRLRAEIEALGGRADFPSNRLGELNQLVGARDSIAKHLGETREEKDAALAQLSDANSQRQELAAYAPLATGNEAEKITEWFVGYLNLSLQKDGSQKTHNRLSEEAGVLEKRLAELSPAFANPENDWQRVASEAAEEEEVASEKCTALMGRIAAEKPNLSAAGRTAMNRRILAMLLSVSAVTLPVLRLLTELNSFPLWVDIGVFAGFAVGAGLAFRAVFRAAEAIRNGESVIRHLEMELESIQEEGSKKRKLFNEAIRNSGFHKADDFLAAARRAEQDRQKLADLYARSAEAEQQRERLHAQSEELYQMLKEGLGKAGLPCSPGSLKFQIDVFRANLRRFRELDAGYAVCARRADSLKSRDVELTNEYNSKCAQIKSLLDEAQVKDPEQFRDECSRSQKMLELLEKEASRTREFSRLKEGLTLEQWKDQLQQLMEQKDPQCLESPSTAEAGRDPSEPYLPYLPTIAEMEEQEKQIGSRLAGTREEYAGAVERVKQAFQNFRPASEIEEDLAIAERTLAELEKNRAALEIALETMDKLSRQQQEVLAPQLNASVEQRFLRLCAGRYEEVKIDPDFQVWVREINSGELRLAEHLSRGTQDQLYFAMRFGIMDLVSNADEPCPGFLDEPFAAYDQARLRKAFDVLGDESVSRQILLFTCREDLLELGLSRGANIVNLEEPEPPPA
jgi:DNA repair exonuclease SbcCD ATPase subunit